VEGNFVFFNALVEGKVGIYKILLGCRKHLLGGRKNPSMQSYDPKV